MNIISRCLIGVCLLCAATLTAQGQNSTFLERGQSQREADVAIMVAVPSASETEELFGVPLYKKKIQPV